MSATSASALVEILNLLGPMLMLAAEPRPVADLVVINGEVWTVDPAHPRAEAIAIVGERIAAVGTTAEIKRWIGPNTRTIEARGNSVLPGFIDAHVHFSNGGGEISGVQLRDAATPAEFARLIEEHARKLPKGRWLLGGDWDHERWSGAPLPTREWIDPLTPNNPVFVDRYDGHMALANSLALRLAGVTRDTPTPPGGAIVRETAGNPSGLLKDAAMDLVFRVIPAQTEEQRTCAVRAAMEEARRLGVTGIHDISSMEDVPVYQQLATRGKLTLRIYCMTPIEQWEARARKGHSSAGGSSSDACVRLGAAKGFADGSLGSSTALFFAPYNDAPETAGLPAAMMFPDGNMLKMALGADRARLQLAIHAIGDKANRIVLDIFDAVRKQNGERADRRWRIEHAQHVRPQDFNDFARLGVIASVQPYHVIDDGRWAEKRLGRERLKTTYAFRTYLDHGVKLAFGSDWTVAPLNPLLGLYAAVTRQTLDGKNPSGWLREQKLTLAEAIEAYTMGSAYAEFAEKKKGSLTTGKLADVVVLNADLFAIPPEKIKDAKVLVTLVGGKIVYEAAEK